MKVIIAGSRNINHVGSVLAAWIKSDFQITELVCGGADGVDSLADYLAKNIFCIPVKYFYPDYNKHPGNVAPLKRNTQMAEYADALIAVWDGLSSGTLHMMREANRLKLPVFVFMHTEKKEE